MYKNIHIGNLIGQRIKERGVLPEKIADRLGIDVESLNSIMDSDDIPTMQLLKISKILEYDFFRVYSMHILLYAPPSMGLNSKKQGAGKAQVTHLPGFRKNAYTIEIIKFIIGKIDTGEMSIPEIIEKYNIPKTTIYRWKQKYFLNN